MSRAVLELEVCTCVGYREARSDPSLLVRMDSKDAMNRVTAKTSGASAA